MKCAIIRHVKSFLIAALASGAAFCAAAAPDVAALNAAREEIRALLAEDFRALNGGNLSLVQLADRVGDLAAASNSAARARVLQEGAFNLYRAAGELPRAAERRVPFWINLGTEAEFAFAACPAGSFKMGFQGDSTDVAFRHKVNFTRPFWIARYQTTKRLYDTFRKVREMSREDEAYGGMDSPMGGIPRDAIDAFCAFLTKRNRDRIPEGYVFRLPTDAEWEYALNANCDDPDDPYVRFRNGDKTVEDEISVTRKFADAVRAAHGISRLSNGSWVGPVMSGGRRKPNAWGIYDMLGNGAEMVLDTLPPDAVKTEYGEGVVGREDVFDYQDEETDPLRFAGTRNVLFVFRGRPRWTRFAASWYCRTVRKGYPDSSHQQVFRVVLAPDILAGRPAKEAAR